MEENTEQTGMPTLPDWVKRMGLFEMKVLCPDEDSSATIRNLTTAEHGDLMKAKEGLSNHDFQKLMIRKACKSWSLKDMDGVPIPHFSEVKPEEYPQQIWARLPGIWFQRISAAILDNEAPGRGSDGLGGQMMKALGLV